MNMTTKRSVIVADLGTGGQRNLLPLGAGYVLSYACAQPDLLRHFDFHLHYLGRDPECARAWHAPAVIGIACHVWNARASLEFAAGIRRVLPDVLIVLGGYSVPSYPERIGPFFQQHPAVDVLVHGEGEETFAAVLRAVATGTPLSEVAGATVRDKRQPNGFRTAPARPAIPDINMVPSPYLNGIFDDVLARYGSRLTGALMETTRGCPFQCTFCDWGKNETKVRRFAIERVYAELDWIARNKIAYIAAADANFGMTFDRDMGIAERLAQLANSTGFPKYFTVNWTKNGSERVRPIANMLRTGGIDPAITSSVQSFHAPTLKAIKRKNISLDAYRTIRAAFMADGVCTYNELILGLPDETCESFIDGLSNLYTSYLTDQMAVYLCLMIENSEMNAPEYRREYAMETRRSPQRWRFQPIEQDTEFEAEEVVVATRSLAVGDWKRAYVYANMVWSLYFSRVAFFDIILLRDLFNIEPRDFFDFVLAHAHDARFPRLAMAVDHVERQADVILNNGPQMQVVEGFGNLAFHPHEAITTILLDDAAAFYEELALLTTLICQEHAPAVDGELIADMVRYQQAAMLVFGKDPTEAVSFSFNVPQIVAALVTQSPVPPLQYAPEVCRFTTRLTLSKNKIEFVKLRARSVFRTEIRSIQSLDVMTHLTESSLACG